MDTCKNCGVEIVRITGRRPKEFCGDNCRAKFWQKNNAKKKVVEKPVVAPEKEEPKEEKKKQPVIPKNNDPKEGSMAFHLKYGAFTYAEAEKLKNTQE